MRTQLLTALLTVILSIAIPATAWSAGSGRGNGTRPGNRDAASVCTVLSSATLSQEEIDTLMYMREEEKMARDLYIRFNEMYGSTVSVFGNIALSEQKHMDAVKGLLDAYKLPDPVVDAIGLFTDKTLAAQYNALIDQGVNLVGALNVGVAVEKQDLIDLADAIAESDESCIDRVYTQLMMGSANHLAAFNRVLGRF